MTKVTIYTDISIIPTEWEQGAEDALMTVDRLIQNGEPIVCRHDSLWLVPLHTPYILKAS